MDGLADYLPGATCQFYSISWYPNRGVADWFVPADVIEFWRRLWIKHEDLFKSEAVKRDADPIEDLDVPQMIRVLHGLPASLTAGRVFIREEYELALEAVKELKQTFNAVILVGHPGIGMVLYLLT